MNKIQGLLNWCTNQVDGYSNVSITNFTKSWKNGLAFNAIIHRFRPDLINYHELEPDNVYYNNYIAFKVAEMHFGIPTLLDPKDMSTMECPERLSIITYVSQFYNCLKEMKPEGGYNINKFENTNNDNSEFETISSRASVTRLTRLKCTICKEKVYLLERYVADDKLYHRKCYRNVQIQNIVNQSEIIGDYLNIYGELKPTMKKGIFVHPLQNFVGTSDIVEIQTAPPVNIMEEVESDNEIDEFENSSGSLSYEYGENMIDERENFNLDEEMNVSDEESDSCSNENTDICAINENKILDYLDVNENLEINNPSLKTNSVQEYDVVEQYFPESSIKQRDQDLTVYPGEHEAEHEENSDVENENVNETKINYIWNQEAKRFLKHGIKLVNDFNSGDEKGLVGNQDKQYSLEIKVNDFREQIPKNSNDKMKNNLVNKGEIKQENYFEETKSHKQYNQVSINNQEGNYLMEIGEDKDVNLFKNISTNSRSQIENYLSVEHELKEESNLKTVTGVETESEYSLEKEIPESQKLKFLISIENEKDIRYVKELSRESNDSYENEIICEEEIRDSLFLKHSKGTNEFLKVRLRAERNCIKEEMNDSTPIRPHSSQENLILNILNTTPPKPVKRRLYIKKRDKELPYSTFFEMPPIDFLPSDQQQVDSEDVDRPSFKQSDNVMKSPIQPSPKKTVSFDDSATSLKNQKKLIEITPDNDYDSDLSSIEDEIYDSVQPKITRNSSWRKPIVNTMNAKKHKSACVPIEGKFRDYAEFKDRLEELNAKQSDVEQRARIIQQKLWEENPNTPLYELLLTKWLDLVEEKDKIFYEENALYSWIKDLKLQEMKLKLEAQIRLLSASGHDDPVAKEREKELVAKLIKTVNLRAELVDAQHAENERRHDLLRSKFGSNETPEDNKDSSPSQQRTNKVSKNPKKFWKRKTSHF